MADRYDEIETTEPSEQVAGRFIGMVVFLAGIVMLVLAFILAYQAFHDPELIIPLGELHKTPPSSPAAVYAPTALRLILLFAMGYIGSLIAARGAQMFFSARKEVRRAAPGD